MISYDIQTIGYINLFEKISKAKVKDCFIEEGQVYFIVHPAQLWKALGKNGANAKKISALIKKPIKIIEFNPNAANFVANLLYPLKAEISMDGKKIIITSSNQKEKGRIFGRDKSKLKFMQKVVSKYFDAEIEVK